MIEAIGAGFQQSINIFYGGRVIVIVSLSHTLSGTTNDLISSHIISIIHQIVMLGNVLLD